MKTPLNYMNLNTLIGMIPSVINNNNDIITNTFDSIYDSSNNYITVPINTTGSISANSGNFVTVTSTAVMCSSISFVGNAATLANLYATNDIFNHNLMFNRNIADQHPISAITNLESRLTSIESSINSLSSSASSVSTPLTASYSLSSTETTNTINTNYITVYNNDVDIYTYPKSYYTTAPAYTTTKYKTKGDYNDVLNKQYYVYSNVISDYVKINNTYPFALNATDIGTQVSIIFDYSNNTTDSSYIIRKTYDGSTYTNIYIGYSDVQYVTLTLVCTNINDYGTQWNILNYNGKIEIK